jgi:plasmid stabilization system protein ParE
MRKAFLQQKAKEDVREIALYIADDNLKAAEAFRLALERVRLTLADLPEIGRAYDAQSLLVMHLRHGTILPYDRAHLDLELGVEHCTTEFLCLPMFRVLPPSAQGLLRRELNDRHSLLVLCLERLEAYEAGHALGERSHTGRHLVVNECVLWAEAGTKNRHNHGTTPPSIPHFKRRTVLRSRLPPVIEPSGGDVSMPQPLLPLGDVGLVVERVGRGRGPQ